MKEVRSKESFRWAWRFHGRREVDFAPRSIPLHRPYQHHACPVPSHLPEDVELVILTFLIIPATFLANVKLLPRAAKGSGGAFCPPTPSLSTLVARGIFRPRKIHEMHLLMVLMHRNGLTLMLLWCEWRRSQALRCRLRLLLQASTSTHLRRPPQHRRRHNTVGTLFSML